jgi:predicted MFS family arabinose efflux permease
MGACGMLVTSFALVRDLFSAEKSAQMYSFLNGAIGISPTFGPIIGGYLSAYFGWESVFLSLACIGVFAILITRLFIQETHPPEKRIPMDLAIFKRYWEIFCHPQFITYALLAGLAEAVFFCFFSISPFIIIGLHGIPTHEFGYYFAVFGAVIALGGLGGGKLIEMIGIQKMIWIGIALMLAGGVSMLAWHYLAEASLQGFLIPMAIACTGSMFVLGGSAAAALEPFGTFAGTASAAFGTLDFGMSAIAGSLLMLFPTTSTVPYGTLIVLMALLSIGLLLARARGKAPAPTES